jgi:hypothetical protein
MDMTWLQLKLELEAIHEKHPESLQSTVRIMEHHHSRMLRFYPRFDPLHPILSVEWPTLYREYIPSELEKPLIEDAGKRGMLRWDGLFLNLGNIPIDIQSLPIIVAIHVENNISPLYINHVAELLEKEYTQDRELKSDLDDYSLEVKHQPVMSLIDA